MEKTLVPTPTEYRGVRFDSKSEAVFARLLDINSVSWQWVHPICHHGHDWDFLIWAWSPHSFRASPDGAEGQQECRVIVYGNPWEDGQLYRQDDGCVTECTYFASILTDGEWSEFVPLTFLEDHNLLLTFGYMFDSRSKLLQARSHRFDLQ